MNQSTCPVCSQPIVGRSDKKTCSAECKRILKRAYDVAYHRDNAAKKVATACAWQRVNRDRKQAYDAEYREKTRDHRLRLKREQGRLRYYSDIISSRDASRSNTARRRARVLGNGVFDISHRDRHRLLVQHGLACAYCRSRFTEANPLEWDHVVPIARGGAHGVGNLVPACLDCNRAKAHRTVMEWRSQKVVTRLSRAA